MINETKISCPYCQDEISSDAIICKTCNSYVKKRKKYNQYNWFKRNSYWINWLGIFISFIVLYIGILQFKNSLEEKTKADMALIQADEALIFSKNALDNAKIALNESKLLLNKLDSIRKETESLTENLVDLNARTIKDKEELKEYQALLLNKEETINTAIIRTNQGELFDFTQYLEFADARHNQGMSEIKWILIRSGDKVKVPIREVKKYFFDVLEVSFISFLVKKYRHNWIRLHSPDFQLLTTETQATTWPKPLQNNYTIWTKHKILDDFENNIFIKQNKRLISNIYLPTNMVVNTKRTDEQEELIEVFEKHERVIKFENQDVELEIKISNGPSYQLDSLYLKVMKLDYLDKQKEWYIQNIKFTFKSTYKPNHSFSKRVAQEYKWIEDMKYLFRQEYDWNLIQNEIKR